MVGGKMSNMVLAGWLMEKHWGELLDSQFPGVNMTDQPGVKTKELFGHAEGS